MHNAVMAEIAQVPYEGYTVYRVFHRKQGRFMAVLVSKEHRTTIAWAKYVLEVHLGRKLHPGFQAHHKDENRLNDLVSNLEEKNGLEHLKDHQENMGQLWLLLDCPVCGREFWVEERETHFAKKKGQTSTCCSRSCGAKKHRSTEVQAIKAAKRFTISEFKSVFA